MTQKELLYLEDAIGHEKNIISVCEESRNYLADDKIITFIDSEIKKHSSILDKLLKLMKGCAK